MNLERIPEIYFPTGKLENRKGWGFSYSVVPDKGNGDLDARVLLSWDDKMGQWLAYLEGVRMEGTYRASFTEGPFDLDAQATRKLCKHYGFRPNDAEKMGDHSGTIWLISATSPEQFKEIKKSSKLEKSSKN